jgi:RHS repeat-associated protein
MEEQGRQTGGRGRMSAAFGLRGILAIGAALCAVALGSASSAADSPATTISADPSTLQAPKLIEGQSATRLPDGRWLLVGGIQSGVVSGTVVIQNSAGDTTQENPSGTPPLNLIYPRYGQTATVLPDGTVAVLGGIGADGNPLTAAEILDLNSGQSQLIADTGLSARSQHTATLLPDGSLLVAGGIGADGAPLSNAQLWNWQTAQAHNVSGGLTAARSGAIANLLPNGDVAISGGKLAQGDIASTVEVYDPQSGSLSSMNPAEGAQLITAYLKSNLPSITVVLPPRDAHNVPVGSRVAILVSTPLQLDSATGQVMSLVGPSGAVAGKSVATNGGRLLFFSPSVDLLPGATYTVFLQGAKDQNGSAFPFSTSSFTTQSFAVPSSAKPTVAISTPKPSATRASSSAALSSTPTAAAISPKPTAQAAPAQKDEKTPQAPDEDTTPEDWIPQEKNRHGDWHVLGAPGDPALSGVPASVSLPKAAAGQTAVAGRVLRYHGKPLAGVTVSIAGHMVKTDSSGGFLLSGLSPGVTQLQVDGTSVWMNGRHYTKHFIRVQVIAGTTTAIPNPIYLPRVDPATEINISSPASKEIVLTHPSIPGLEVHIPKGVVLREYDGKIVTKLSITPIPLDRPPYPTPASFSVYFTLQPGGAFVDPDSTKSIRVIYPNYQGLPAGTRADFWNYDPAQGWQIYGRGTVSANGKQVIPDANVGFRQIISFGMGLSKTSAPPPNGPPVNGCTQGGDPVDCATGLFLHTETDIAIRDTIPITVTRTYRQNDPTSRSFGIGTNLSYNMSLYTDSTANIPPEVDLILSDGSRVPYLFRSGTALSNSVWVHTGTPSIFYGSTLAAFSSGGNEGFTITLLDKTIMQFGSDPPNGILSITDRNGNALTFTTASPHTGGNITRVTSPSGRYVQFTYNAGLITQATDNIGRSAFYNYDGVGRLSSVTDPDGNTEYFAYDSQNRMTTVTDKRGNTMVTNTYDTSSYRVVKQVLADGATWQFSYILATDGSGNVTQTTTTDPRGNVRQDTFNSSGYLTQEIRAVGKPEQQSISIQRDADNLVLSETDALGRTTQLSHDGFGNVSGVTRLANTANAVTASFTYGTYQQTTSYTDPLGHRTTLGYDWLGNLTSAQDPLGNSAELTNDSLGRPLAITNPLGNVTQLTYDSGDLSAATDPLGRTESIFHDAVGRTIGVSDPLGDNTRIQYDAMDRAQQITDALGGQTSLSYDPNGNVLTVQDPRATGTHGFSYDARNRVHVYTDPLGNTETYNYDGMGNLTSKVDRKGQTTSYSYDGLNRLQTITYADSSNITITWDAGNRPTQFADTVNGTIARQYDGLDRLTQETTPQGQMNYVYDAEGRRTQLTVAGLAAVTYQYDDDNRLTQIAQGATVVGLTYDAASRRSSVTLPNGMVATPTYDAANQLLALSYDLAGTHIGDLAYSYDQAGRRTGESGSLATLAIPASVPNTTYDAANRLTSWGGSALSYDANGNLTALGSSTYTWDARNHLIATSDGSGAFSYDALGRRTSSSIGGVTNSYSYDGLNPAMVNSDFMIDGLGLDETYARVNSAGTTSYVSDAVGSTLALTNGGGATTASYSYEPYGNTTKAGADDSAFQFTGRENDEASDLYYYRARYYSPQLGRFISQDPIGFNGGLNWYAYADGNPISEVDPTGLAGLGIIGGGTVELGRTGGNAFAYQANSGVGIFLPYGGINLEVKGFTSSGGGYFPVNGGTSCDGQIQKVKGGTIGLGSGLFFTNANNRDDLLGPFDTRTISTPVGSIQWATSGSTWFFDFTIGPSVGFAFSRYAVTTTNVIGR